VQLFNGVLRGRCFSIETGLLLHEDICGDGFIEVHTHIYVYICVCVYMSVGIYIHICVCIYRLPT